MMIDLFRKQLGYPKKVSVFFILLSIFQSSPAASDESGNGIHVFSADTVYEIGSFDLKRGERMFYGLVPITEEAMACADCHYTHFIDTINWNPSAYDIAKTFAGKNMEDLLEVVNSPRGTKMSEVHAGYEISEEEAILLQAYLEKLNHEKEPVSKPVIDKLLLFILINLIGIAAIVDLLFVHKIPYRAVHLIIILGATVYIMQVLVTEAIAMGRQQGYEPTQPIKFSHKIHAGDNKIDCQYCHTTPEFSKSASIPPANLCMNCHVLIVEGTRSGKFEISKISAAQENMDPIEWVRIHNLPDHVFFSHAQHVGVGGLDCAECHGNVEEMHQVRQVEDLSMGWCLDCHRTRGVDFVDNEYYAIYEAYHDQLEFGEMDSVTVEDIGGTNCMKCHY